MLYWQVFLIRGCLGVFIGYMVQTWSFWRSLLFFLFLLFYWLNDCAELPARPYLSSIYAGRGLLAILVPAFDLSRSYGITFVLDRFTAILSSLSLAFSHLLLSRQPFYPHFPPLFLTCYYLVRHFIRTFPRFFPPVIISSEFLSYLG